MNQKINLFQYYCTIFLIFTLINTELKAQGVVNLNSNDVISYCYQPLQNGLHQLYAINSECTNNRKIINASVGLNHHNWSPDTMKFVIVGYVDTGNTTWSIYTFNSNGTNLIRLTSIGNVWDAEPIRSYDMTKISYTRIFSNQNMKNEL
jgi:hypothetical protein